MRAFRGVVRLKCSAHIWSVDFAVDNLVEIQGKPRFEYTKIERLGANGGWNGGATHVSFCRDNPISSR